MKYLKLFENFSNDIIEMVCKEYNITNYTIKDGIVDVRGNVDFYLSGLEELPFKFGEVTGDFICYNKLKLLISNS